MWLLQTMRESGIYLSILLKKLILSELGHPMLSWNFPIDWQIGKRSFVWLIFCFDTSVLFTRRTFKICICDHHDRRTLGHYELLNYDIRWGSWCCAREDWLERYISICWKRTFFRIFLTWLISRTNRDISFVIDGTIHLRKTTVNAVELLLSILMFCSFVPC